MEAFRSWRRRGRGKSVVVVAVVRKRAGMDAAAVTLVGGRVATVGV